MLKEVFVTGTNICLLVGTVVLVTRMILYYYIETVNDYSGWPSQSTAIESILYYDKKVRPKDEGLKRFCNRILKIGWSTMGIAVILGILSIIIP